MTAFDACRGPWARLFLLAVVSVASPTVLPGLAQAADPVPVGSTDGGTILVHLDQAQVLKLPERTATLVIGNPLVADAVVQPGGVVVITAKSYGATNLIALDRTGAKLLENAIQVVGPNDNVVVVVYRGVERETYSCGPDCARRITIGDTPTYFTANLNQVGTQNALAQGQMKQ